MSEEKKEKTQIGTKSEEQNDENKSETKEEVPAKDEKAEEKKEVVVPAKFKSIVEEVEKMSVLDLSELVKILEDKFGVSAAPVAVASVAAAVAGGEGAGAEEKDSFDVELAAAGDNKIGVIKVVREVTGKGLKDAKDMVEAAPTVLKESVKKEEAEEIKKKVEEAGGNVNLK